MPSIDERIVSMAFENRVFESRVAQTMATLSKLDTTLKNMGSTSGLENIEKSANKVTLSQPMSALDKLKIKLGGAGSGAAEGLGEIDKAGNKVTLEGPSRALDNLRSKFTRGVAPEAIDSFSEVEKAANRVTLEGVGRAIDAAAGKFNVLATAASVALGNIASQTAMKGVNFAKSFGFGPIMDGLNEYQTNLQAIQTVQANTDQPLTNINRSLQELNTYSDQTIYNFGEMAKNIGTFTAAGVDLKTATSSIKGIANMAALSGSTSQQAATAMYQLSQAISSGRVGLQDWNSVVNAGMGGKKLQTALATTGQAMGVLGKNTVKLEGPMKKLTINGKSFRESIMKEPGGPEPWLTSDILVNTLATLDGRFSKAALSAEKTKDGLKKYTSAQIEAKIADSRAALEKKNGVKYTDEQFKSLMKLSDSAFKSATEVKTLGQVFDVAKETIGSGWSASFQSIFGNLKEAKELFTGMSNTINGFINASALARNTLLHDWKKMGGRDELLGGLRQGFTDIILVFKQVRAAFRNIFPPQTAEGLFDMTKGFHELMVNLRPSPEVLGAIYHAFRAFFSILHIGWTVIKEVGGVIGDLLGEMGKGQGGFVRIVRSISHFIVAIDEALTKGGLLHSFFDGLSAVLKVPIDLIKILAGAIAGLFTGQGEEGAKGFESTLDGVKDKLGPLKKVLDIIVNVWHALSDAVGKAKDALEPWLSGMVQKLQGFGNVLVEAFKNLDFEKVMSFIRTGLVAGLLVTIKKALGEKGVVSELKGALGGLSDVLGGFTKNLETMQQNIKANTILQISVAVLALASGIYILSTIDGKKLSKAMTAVAVGLGELMGAMKMMSAGMGLKGVLMLPIIAGSMIGLAVAVTILAGAVKIFSTMSWEDIAKGLVGITGALAGIGLAMNLISAPKMVATSLALIPLGIALGIIAGVVKVFGSMSWKEMIFGLLGMASAIALIGNAMVIMPPNLPLTAAGLLILGVGLSGVAAAVKAFGSMDILTLIKGLGAMVLAIAGIGLAVSLIPPTIALSAAGLLILGQAMVVTAGAVALLGSLSIGTLVKGITALAATLIVLAAGLTLMVVALPGAAALMVAAGALAVMVPVIGLLGSMKWDTIFKGLAAIGLAMVTIGIAGLLAAPGLVALGIALVPMGISMLIVAKAAQLFAQALQIMGSEGQKGVGVMVAALTGFIAILPTIVIQFIKGLLGIVDQVAQLAPKVVIALGVIIDTIIAFVIQSVPKLAIAIGVLIVGILQVLVENTPKIIAAGAKLFMDLLNGISTNIEQITTKVSEIIVKFMTALQEKAPQLIDAGFKLLTTFLTGISSHYTELVTTVGNMITQFVTAVAGQYARIATVAGTMMLRFLSGISNFVPRLVNKGGEIILRFLDGLSQNVNKIANKGADVVIKFIQGITSNINKIASKGADAVIKFLHGLADTIRTRGPELIQAGLDIADALIDGVTEGFGLKGGLIKKALEAVFKLLPGWAKKVLGIKSPSTVFAEIGGFLMEGMSVGIESGAKGTMRSMASTAKDVANSAKLQLGRTSMFDGVMETQPVITPVLDLSNVHKEATKLDSLGRVIPITAAASFNQARAISTEKTAVDAASTDLQPAVRQEPKIHFEQNNYSPESLSSIDIYRQTNNQLAMAKRALT